MTPTTTELGPVRYNAAEQCFEALVTVDSETARHRVASRFNAPLNTAPEIVDAALRHLALRRPGLQSELPRAA